MANGKYEVMADYDGSCSVIDIETGDTAELYGQVLRRLRPQPADDLALVMNLDELQKRHEDFSEHND